MDISELGCRECGCTKGTFSLEKDQGELELNYDCGHEADHLLLSLKFLGEEQSVN